MASSKEIKDLTKEISKAFSIKTGIKTSEFWISVATVLAGLGTMLGYFTPTEAAGVTNNITVIVGGLMTTISSIVYAFSRSTTKTNVTAENMALLVTAINQLIASSTVPDAPEK